MKPLFLFYPQHEDRQYERLHLTESQAPQTTVHWFVVLQEILNPGIEFIRRVDRLYDLLVTLDQLRILHLGNKVDRAVGVVTRRFGQ